MALDFRKLHFVKSCTHSAELPDNGLPGIALLGRSNVGKSSFINTLGDNSTLARTSSTPGKTRLINCYQMPELMLFDLPGYGYAQAGREDQARWRKLTEEFLNTAGCLKLGLLLVDLRRTPNEDDVLMHNWAAASQIPLIVIATKCDKVKKSQWEKQRLEIAFALKLDFARDIILFSSQTKRGRDDVMQKLTEFAR